MVNPPGVLPLLRRSAPLTHADHSDLEAHIDRFVDHYNHLRYESLQNLTPADVIANPGWFFVLQQQPTEPRFGMDDDPFGPGESGVIPELKTWNDLNWAHVAPNAAALKALSHVPVNKIMLTPTTPQKGTWRRNSAHMAYITKQLPARVAIHASEMIPSPVSLPNVPPASTLNQRPLTELLPGTAS